MHKPLRPIPLLACAALLTPGACLAHDLVVVNFNAATREYCHVLRFPLGWAMHLFFVDDKGRRQIAPGPFNLGDDYEFRVPGLLETRFLVRGMRSIVDKYYTSNIYNADFSDPKGIAQPTSEGEWISATPIPFVQGKSSDGGEIGSNYLEFKGRRFVRTGDKWFSDEGRLSPDRSVLVVQSYSGKLGPGGTDVPLDFSVIFKPGGKSWKALLRLL